jgi:hypothetical protein
MSTTTHPQLTAGFATRDSRMNRVNTFTPRLTGTIRRVGKLNVLLFSQTSFRTRRTAFRLSQTFFRTGKTSSHWSQTSFRTA